MTRHTVRYVSVLAALVVLFSGRVGAQAAGTPQAIARQFFAALAVEDWDAAVKLMDTAPIVQERDQQLMMARAVRAMAITPQNLMKSDSTLTLEDAKQRAAMIDRMMKTRPAMFTNVFSGVKDTTELAALTPARAAAAWLMRSDSRVQLREAAVAAHCASPPVGAFKQWEPHTILGVVENGDDAWVLHRDPQMQTRGQGLNQIGPMMLTMHRANGAWQIIPSATMMSAGYISMLAGVGAMQSGCGGN